MAHLLVWRIRISVRRYQGGMAMRSGSAPHHKWRRQEALAEVGVAALDLKDIKGQETAKRSVEMSTTSNDRNLAGDTFGATELNDVISRVPNRSSTLENHPLAHRFNSFRR